MSTTSTGPAAMAYQALAAAPRAGVINPGDHWYAGAPRSVSQQC
jgi:hypothetical protein